MKILIIGIKECHSALPEVETPNNFCPSRFLQVCSDFHFLQTQICTENVSEFSLHLCRRVCLDLRFEENENLNTLEKI